MTTATDRKAKGRRGASDRRPPDKPRGRLTESYRARGGGGGGGYLFRLTMTKLSDNDQALFAPSCLRPRCLDLIENRSSADNSRLGGTGSTVVPDCGGRRARASSGRGRGFGGTVTSSLRAPAPDAAQGSFALLRDTAGSSAMDIMGRASRLRHVDARCDAGGGANGGRSSSPFTCAVLRSFQGEPVSRGCWRRGLPPGSRSR